MLRGTVRFAVVHTFKKEAAQNRPVGIEHEFSGLKESCTIVRWKRNVG